MATPRDFAVALLNRFGLPTTENRLVGLIAFAAKEGGHWANGARYNPFNTSLSMPGAVSVIGQVKAYPNWETGIEATARTISQSNMRPILQALKADATPMELMQAITATPWCPQNAPGCSSYATGDLYALARNYSRRQDDSALSATPMAAGIDWKRVAFAAVVVGAGALTAYYLMHKRLPRLPLLSRA